MANLTKLEALRSAIGQSEAHLVGQRQILVAADQRAFAFTSLAIVAAAILLQISLQFDTRYCMEISFCCVFVAAFLSAVSASPVRFYGEGSKFSDFEPYFSGNFSEEQLLLQLGKRNDERVGKNADKIRVSKQLFRSALFIALLAGIAATIGIFVAVPREVTP